MSPPISILNRFTEPTDTRDLTNQLNRFVSRLNEQFANVATQQNATAAAVAAKSKTTPTASLGPGTPTPQGSLEDPINLTATVTHKQDLLLQWAYPTTLPRDFAHFQVRVGTSWDAGTLVHDTKHMELLITDPVPRVSELVGVTGAQIDVNRNVLHIMGKGGKERALPLHPRTIEALQRFTNGRSGPIFLTRLGEPMVRQGFSKMVRERCVAAGLPHINAHGFRHAFATRLREQGVDTRVIQELLGHSDIGTTQIYAHTSPSQLRDVYRRFHPRAA